MSTKMKDLYKKQTGRDAWSSFGLGDDGCALSVYVESPTADYISWLEDRASKAIS